ncbi:MAG: excinuclease ABC subunit UvrB [Alphaproteobacteria bacterium]
MGTLLPLLYNTTKEKQRSFVLKAPFMPKGDQPKAIKELTDLLEKGEKNMVLLGVTGSGKTFTMANVIQNINRPTLILAPNKTLAAQLYTEMREFFPENAIEYFVSYYDYYQPEAYIPKTNTYIEKTASINEEIDRMRHSATRALLERRDVVIVASVSCIYGIGAVTTYSEMIITLKISFNIDRHSLSKRLVELQYKRSSHHLSRGEFRIKGDNIEIFPSHYADRSWKISFFGDEIESISEVDVLTGKKCQDLKHITIFANSHYVAPGPTLQQAIKMIKKDLNDRLIELKQQNKLVEVERLSQKVHYDLEMIKATGICNGIENYSRYLTGRNPGEPPPTLFEYLPKDALLIVDESHVAVPQLSGMFKGDRSRKTTLSEFGFRLPSCRDNRPLMFEEWDLMRPQTIFVSATPGDWELTQTKNHYVEQIIRPTGLLDPYCEVHPCEAQVDDLIYEMKQTIKKGCRVLVTTLTKKMAEGLTEYLDEADVNARYLHSDITTLDRVEILYELRQGVFDVLIGINLLREGLDIPECGLIAILDADKEGFLRSKTSLIQTIGRAARNVEGRVILYADHLTKSITSALQETQRRREIQKAHNDEHGIIPQSVVKNSILKFRESVYEKEITKENLAKLSLKEITRKRFYLKKKMKEAAYNFEFEEAARIRDAIYALDYHIREDGLSLKGK